MLILLIPFIAIAVFVVFLNTPKGKGWLGEKTVKATIGKTIKNEQYVINDLIIARNGKSCQIDHIVINPNGVFVIETKNYSGDIYGTKNQTEWTQVLAYGKVKNKIYNPIKQNAVHVYSVKKIVGKLPVYSLVVFVKNNTYHIQAENVVSLTGLKAKLNQGSPVLTITQMQTAYNSLLASKTTVTKQKHVHKIKRRQQNLSRGICPRCGGKLVDRKGRYGAFIGCSNYPRCKFIKSK